MKSAESGASGGVQRAMPGRNGQRTLRDGGAQDAPLRAGRMPALPADSVLVLYVLLMLGFSLASGVAQQGLEVSGLTEEDPLTISAEATAEELRLRVELNEEWHLYGPDAAGGVPVSVEMMKGSCFEAAGPLEVPVNAKGEITGKAVITVPLRRVADGEVLKARFQFMACDPLMCMPPREVTLQGRVGSGDAGRLRVLLVVVEAGERSERIAAFLGERGFACTVVPYSEVSAEACEQHDVVVADSPYFGQSRKATRFARSFPETKTPLVAVGFLGTELLEGHRIAMACGYI